MGADDFGLTYFRFDGRRYHHISAMEFRSCSKVDQRFCMEDGHPALNTDPGE